MTTKTELLNTIRQHCLNCSGSLEDVENCTAGPDAFPFKPCILWKYRLGIDPDQNTSIEELAELIREKCLDCCSGSRKDVKNCAAGPNANPSSQCALWEYRLGTDQKPKLHETLESMKNTKFTAVAQDA